MKRAPRWIWIVLLLACGLAPLRAQTNLAVLTTDGAWTWFNDPRALYYNGTLYFSYVRAVDGHAVLSTYNLQTGGVTNLWDGSLAEVDDHDVAGLLPKLDGTMLAIHSRHGDDQFFTYRLSNGTNPVAAADWGAEQRNSSQTNVPTGMTYANPFQLAAEAGKIYNFGRYLNWNPNVFTSTDGGNTWSTPQIVILTGSNNSVRPYVKYCSDYQRRLDLFYTDGHPDEIPTSLYHLYYQAGAFHQTDGTLLKSFADLPILHDSGERGTLVYSYNTAPQADPNQWIPNARAWCWEIASQTNGAPFCVFQTKVDQVTGANWDDARIYYYYARWTGTNWQKRFVAQGGRPLYDGQPDYGGGMALDPLDPTTIYVATDAAKPFDLTTTANVPLGNHFELWKGTTADGGLSFSWQAITTNSTLDNLRPYIPRRFGGQPSVLWFQGNYTTYSSFNCSVLGLFTTPIADGLPPAITQNPASITNAYVGDNAGFTAQATGSLPLRFQWSLNGNPIPVTDNPSGVTASLSLTNVQMTNAGSYALVVTNVWGAVTSTAARLIVHPYPPASGALNQTVLQLQFVAAKAYLTPPAHQQPGWQTMSLNSGPTVLTNGIKVTLSAVGGATLTDRDRVVQGGYPLVANNPPALTTANLYNSFIYDSTTTAGTGLEVLIQNLAPNSVYGVNLWSFASASGGRISDWTEVISGRSLARSYTTAAPLPLADYDSTIGALLVSDASGQLKIQGVFDSASPAGSVDVFLNALEITANPVRRFLSATLAADGNLALSARGQFSGQALAIQESADLVHWQVSTDAVNLTMHGPVLEAEFPLGTNRRFYRLTGVP